ncbi:MAG TPA: hypothetical protein PKE29_11005 [Phycisphaerales bacterium]|nr:hypothetical protein [Phycisphaerales bacterium]
MSDDRTQIERTSNLDPEEAKLRLLEWSIETDAEIHARIEGLVGQAKKAAPWAAGLALVSGLVLGRTRRKRDPSGPSGGLPIASILRIATVVAPVVLQILKARREVR